MWVFLCSYGTCKKKKSSPEIRPDIWQVLPPRSRYLKWRLKIYIMNKKVMLSPSISPREQANPPKNLPAICQWMSLRENLHRKHPDTIDFPIEIAVSFEQKSNQSMSGAAVGRLWGAAADLQRQEPHRAVAEAGLLFRPSGGLRQLGRCFEAKSAGVAPEGRGCPGRRGGVDAWIFGDCHANPGCIKQYKHILNH